MGLLLTLITWGTARLLFVNPVQEGRKQVVVEMMETTKLKKSATEIRTDYTEAKETLRRINLRAKLASQQVPNRLGEKQFLLDLNSLARREQIMLLDIIPGVVDRDEKCCCMSFQIAAAGTYKQICGLMDELSRSKRLITVSDLTIRTSEQSELYGLDIKIAIYFKTLKKVAARDHEVEHG